MELLLVKEMKDRKCQGQQKAILETDGNACGVCVCVCVCVFGEGEWREAIKHAWKSTCISAALKRYISGHLTQCVQLTDEETETPKAGGLSKATRQVIETPNSWISVLFQLQLSITFLKHLQHAKHCSRDVIDINPFSSWQHYVVGLFHSIILLSSMCGRPLTPGSLLGRQR